jgi:hypothetical protein
MHPPRRGTQQVGVLAQQGAAAVGDHPADSGPPAERELVAEVLLGAAVPVEVVLAQRRHGDDGGTEDDVGGLVAGGLHDPPVDVLRRIGVPGGGAEVATQQHPLTEPRGQVSGDRGRGALALGAGDAEDPVAVGLGQPQPETTGHRHAGGLQ